MELRYTVIKNDDQYIEYCNRLETLVFEDEDKNADEIELLEVLIEKYDDNDHFFNASNYDPIDIVKILMKNNRLNQVDLSNILGIGKSTVSKMFSRKKAMSKDTIRILADYFKISQEALNRKFKHPQNIQIKTVTSVKD